MLTDTPMIWRLVTRLLADGANPNREAAYRRRLVDVLNRMDAAAVARVHFELHLLRVESRRRTLWCAASLWLGHWLDDGEFQDFRAWLIAHGESIWQSVVADPDALVGMRPMIERKGERRATLAALNTVPGKVWQRLVANDPALADELRDEHQRWCAQLPDGGDDTAIGWAYWSLPDRAELARSFPQLWADHRERWPTDQPNPFKGFLRAVEIPGLGEVKLGDTLIGRYDNEPFVVEGLSDPLAAFDLQPDSSEFSLVIAKVRHKDGTVACNQGLGRRFQRWPSEPAVGPLPGDPPHGWQNDDHSEDDDSAARDAIDAAIQAQIAANIEGELRVVYAAAPEDADGLPIDNLAEVALAGPVRFVEIDDRDGARYESGVVDSPTWLQVAVLANDMLRQLDYQDHVYLEGVRIKRRPKGAAKVAEFLLGS
jgi:hypothetical protein